MHTHLCTLQRCNVHIQCMYSMCLCIHVCAPCMYVCTNTYTAGAARHRPLSPSPSQHTKHTTCNLQHTALCPLNPRNTRCSIGYRVNSNVHASSWWSLRQKMNHWDDAKREIIEVPSVLASGWIMQMSVLSVLGSSSFMTMNHRDTSFRPVCCSVLESWVAVYWNHPQTSFRISLSRSPSSFQRKPRGRYAKMLLLMMRVCWRALTCVDICWCRLMCGDVGDKIQLTAYTLQHTPYKIQHTRLMRVFMLMYVDVCWCTLMCADVCSSCLCLICRGNLELCQDATATAASAPILRPPLAGVASARVRWWSRRGHLRYHRCVCIHAPQVPPTQEIHPHTFATSAHLNVHQQLGVGISGTTNKKDGYRYKRALNDIQNCMHEKRPVTKSEWPSDSRL